MTFDRTRLIRALDILLWLSALWFVLPPLVLGREVEIPLPFGAHLSSSLSQNNLLFFWAVLVARMGVRSKGEAARGRLSPWAEAWLIGFGFFLVYLACAQGRAWPSGDTIPNKLLPISILEEGNLDLNEFVKGIFVERRYGLYHSDGRAFSAYPLGPALVALPVYSVFRLLSPSAFHSWQWAYSIPGGDDLPNVANFMEQFTAALISALAAVVFWRLCLRVTDGHRKASRWFTVAYALGTPLMSTASQALWQNGPACLSLVLMFYLLSSCGRAGARPSTGDEDWPTGGAPSWATVAFAGLCGGWAYVCRPTTALITGFAGLWLLIRRPRQLLLFAAPCAAVAAAFMAWNYRMFGSIAGGGYAQNLDLFTAFDARVFLALLFSPSRGLFVFSPFLLFAAVLGVRQVVKAPLSLAAFCLYGALATVVLFSCWKTWAGGVSFGSRYLCEAALLLALVLPFGHRLLQRRAVWTVFLLAVLFSCHLHIMGARHGDRGWTGKVFKGDDLATMWRWRDSQLVWTLLR